MNFNKKYIDIKVALINSILSDTPENILDVSYSYMGDRIELQIVVLKGTDIDKSLISRIECSLSKYKTNIKVLHCSKETFNSNKGNWRPLGYNWLDHILYSKSETL